MILICDYCGMGKNQIFKLPSSAFYVQDGALISSNDYINMCTACLVTEKEKEQ